VKLLERGGTKHYRGTRARSDGLGCTWVNPEPCGFRPIGRVLRSAEKNAITGGASASTRACPLFSRSDWLRNERPEAALSYRKRHTKEEVGKGGPRKVAPG
jgi:hypothetical protein